VSRLPRPAAGPDALERALEALLAPVAADQNDEHTAAAVESILLSAVEAARLLESGLAERRASIARFLDTLEQPALVCSAFTPTSHCNAALRTFLQDQPHAAEVLDGMAEFGRGLTEVRRRSCPDLAVRGSRRAVARKRLGRVEYVLTATCLPEPLIGFGAVAVVTLGTPHAVPGEAIMIERYHLTVREAQVAALLQQRRSNREIAERLSISLHTARHHVEAVMSKLGVTSRAAVRERLRI
jgi:DNA-binding CsgD family transcriptional regulator